MLLPSAGCLTALLFSRGDSEQSFKMLAFSGPVTKDKKQTADKKKPAFIFMLCCNLLGKKKFSAIFSHILPLFCKKFMV